MQDQLLQRQHQKSLSEDHVCMTSIKKNREKKREIKKNLTGIDLKIVTDDTETNAAKLFALFSTQSTTL